MVDFSRVNINTTLGRLIRYPLKVIPKNSVLPIIQGPAKGMKWIVGSGVHGYWLGSYEGETQKLITKYLHPGDTFYDLGAHTGFFGLIASRLVGEEGHVYCFEPCRRNVFYLKRHIELNNIRNIEIIESAVGQDNKSAFFCSGGDSFTGSVSSQGDYPIEQISIDDFVFERRGKVPRLMKVDVEGAELFVLKGASKTISTHHPPIIVSTHSEEVKTQCMDFVLDQGYDISSGGRSSCNYFVAI